jgi:hypothetical protein
MRTDERKAEEIQPQCTHHNEPLTYTAHFLLSVLFSKAHRVHTPTQTGGKQTSACVDPNIVRHLVGVVALRYAAIRRTRPFNCVVSSM